MKTSFDRTLIESIFYSNKSTQKQLSTKGTEIDIISLILYALHPVQEPIIYLPNNGIINPSTDSENNFVVLILF